MQYWVLRTIVLQTLSHHDHFLNTPVEHMHLIKNIVEHIVRLVSCRSRRFA